MHLLTGALPLPYAPTRDTRDDSIWLLIGSRLRLLAVEHLSIAEPLCPSQCLFETILLILCLMEWAAANT